MKKQLLTLLADGKTAQVIAVLRQLPVVDKEIVQLIILTAARFAALEKQQYGNTLAHDHISIERNQINAELWAIIDELPDNIVLSTHNQPNNMEQHHSGSGDNVAGDRIDRQINMGKGSTYIENNGDTAQKDKNETYLQTMQDELPKIAETQSGVLATLLGWLPESLRPIVAVLLLGLGTFVGYYYFMPKPESAQEKVFVSGIIHIDNAEPKQNEIKCVALKDIDANLATIASDGTFSFKAVKIPENKRLSVNVTFADGKIVPTNELIVGEADKATKTVRLPDLNVTRPQLAKDGKPATSWQIQTGGKTGNNN